MSKINSITELNKYFPLINLQTLYGLSKKAKFPVTEENGEKVYNPAEVALWLAANPKAFKKDISSHLKVPQYQQETIIDEKIIDKNLEQARLYRVQRERQQVKLEIEKSKVCDRKLRDADEAERLSILKRYIYNCLYTATPKFLEATSVSEINKLIDETLYEALTSTQSELKRLSDESLEAKPPADPDEDLDEDAEEIVIEEGGD